MHQEKEDNDGSSLLGGGNHMAATTLSSTKDDRERNNHYHNSQNDREGDGEALAATLETLAVDLTRRGNVHLYVDMAGEDKNNGSANKF